MLPLTVQTDHPPLPAPAEYAGRSPYHLTQAQIEFFDAHGYLVLRNWIPAPLLHKLQAAGQAWIDMGQHLPDDDPNRVDFSFAQREGGRRVMYRVNYLHNKGQAVSLELLGSPYVLGVAESLCGQNFVPTYESMVFKEEGDGEEIAWHQDAVHPRRYRIFNYDLYLDESRTGAGALRVIPKSQGQAADICRLRDEHGWSPAEYIDVEMNPGDVLLHDVMVVHGSERTLGAALRRTIYYEFRAAEEILADGPWDETWIDKRLRLLPVALRHHQQAFPQAAQFDWQISPEFRPQPAGTEAEELRIAHLIHMSGAYCSAGDAIKKQV
ncbi:MAG: phytanoyl-CoA dioxygenase family protein [Anaerolineae bacterium]|nr:phytanoyl-CoA dioxygenase family protein [Anaerolineae bacterium]